MAKNSTIGWSVFGVAAIFSVVLLLLLAPASPLSVTGDNDDGDTNTGGCNIAPSLNVPVVNAYQLGTSVDAGLKYLHMDAVSSTKPDFVNGKSVSVFANASDYIDTVETLSSIECGANSLKIEMAAYSEPSIELKDDSMTTLTDADNTSAATNKLDSIAAGASESVNINLQGTVKKTTGDFVYVFEAPSNVDSMTLCDDSSCLEEVDVPGLYDETLSDPETVAFKIPAIEDAISKSYTLTLTADSNNGVSDSAVYTTAYVGEAYETDSGEFEEWGVENEDEEAVYEATFDYDFFISA